MAIAFVGTHVPLIIIIFYSLFGPGQAYSPTEIIVLTLAATLAAAVGTLLLVEREVRPVRRAACSLTSIPIGENIPELPQSPSLELTQLFTAINESYRRAQVLTEERKQVAAKLARQIAQAETSQHNVLEKLVNTPLLEESERQSLYNRLHIASTSQIDTLRSIHVSIGEISSTYVMRK
jgi:hypothetical protein